MRRPPAVVAALVVFALVPGACGDDDGSGGSGGSGDATTTTSAPDVDTLPGRRVDAFPHEGAELAVAGVPAGDTLDVRSGPGPAFDVVVALEPLATDVVATGHNRSLDGAGVWAEVTADGREGWADTAHLLQLGQVDDITAAMFPSPADRPRAETMLELATMVGAMRAGDDPPSDVVVVDGPTVGDLGEVTVDVIGLGDDAVGGERLRIFAEPDPGGESFTVRTVEMTVLCTRGVAEDGLCV